MVTTVSSVELARQAHRERGHKGNSVLYSCVMYARDIYEEFFGKPMPDDLKRFEIDGGNIRIEIYRPENEC